MSLLGIDERLNLQYDLSMRRRCCVFVTLYCSSKCAFLVSLCHPVL